MVGLKNLDNQCQEGIGSSNSAVKGLSNDGNQNPSYHLATGSYHHRLGKNIGQPVSNAPSITQFRVVRRMDLRVVG